MTRAPQLNDEAPQPDAGRRDVRHLAHFPVTLRIRNEDLPLFTQDVSYRGLSLRTREPLPMRQLVQMRLGDPALQLVGMVVRNNEAFHGWETGIQLIGLSDDVQRRWNEIVGSAMESVSLRALDAELDEDGHDLITLVNLGSDLERLYALAETEGGLFVRTEALVPENRIIRLEVRHAELEESVRLRARVRRWIRERGKRGLALQLLPLDAERRERLWALMRAASDHDTQDAPPTVPT